MTTARVEAVCLAGGNLVAMPGRLLPEPASASALRSLPPASQPKAARMLAAPSRMLAARSGVGA